MVFNFPSVVFRRQMSLVRSANFSSATIPYLTNKSRYSHLLSKSARSALNNSFNLSLTFLLMCWVIFFTLASLCKELRDTFNGMSGESITPFNNTKYSGNTSFTSSVTKTWLQYNCTRFCRLSMASFTFGKYNTPVRLKG